MTSYTIETYAMKLAYVTLSRIDEPATATILAKQYQETIPCWDIHWTPNHVVFYVDPADTKKIIAYRADRVFEVITEDREV